MLYWLINIVNHIWGDFHSYRNDVYLFINVYFFLHILLKLLIIVHMCVTVGILYTNFIQVLLLLKYLFLISQKSRYSMRSDMFEVFLKHRLIRDNRDDWLLWIVVPFLSVALKVCDFTYENMEGLRDILQKLTNFLLSVSYLFFIFLFSSKPK